MTRALTFSKAATVLGVLGFLAVSPAWADDDCFVPMADWQPRDAVQHLAESQGWTVRRIKIDDGCYEIDGRDAENRHIEVTVHPRTLAVIDFEYEDDSQEGLGQPASEGDNHNGANQPASEDDSHDGANQPASEDDDAHGG